MTNENKSIDKMLIVRVCLVALMFVVGAALYPYLPDSIPTHWGFEGRPDAWGPKTWGAWITPLMSLGFLVLMPLLAKIDPRRANYELFKKPWSVIQTSLILFMAYMYAVTMYVTFYPEYNDIVGRAVVFGVGILFVLMGNVMGKVRQNYFVGLKTPWTLNDPEVWQKSQRFGGWVFVLTGLAFMIEGVVWIAVMPVFFVATAVVVVLPIVYSYLLSRKSK